jgi:hypothetical protein
MNRGEIYLVSKPGRNDPQRQILNRYLCARLFAARWS